MKFFKDVSSVIEKQYFNKLGILVVLIIFGAILEAMGISLIIPLISSVLSEDFKIPEKVITFLPFLRDYSREDLVSLTIISFILFYIFKSIFLIFLTYAQARYTYSLQESLSTRLYRIYLDQDYSFHLKRNSGEIISNTITETVQFAQGLMAPLIYVITDICIILCICALLIYVEPIGAISIMLIFSIGSGILYSFSKIRSERWGEKRQENEINRMKSAQQGLSGIKEIKLHGFENIFSNIYAISTRITLNSGMKQTTLQGTPKIFFEFLTVLSISSLVFILSDFGLSSSELISILSLFGLAAFKLLPSIARLVTNLQALKFATPVINKIKKELELMVSKEHGSIEDLAMNFKKDIVLDNVSFSYEDTSKPALYDINLKIKQGQSVGIIGSSGAGKSTLVDIILGLLSPTTGKLIIDDTEINKTNISSWQKNIGYVSQSIYLLDDTYKKNIGFGLSNKKINDSELKNAIKLSKLKELIETLPNGVDSLIGESGVRISGGQRQRIGIARALYKNPDLLVLDEATSALDNETEKDVMDSINNLQGNMTIIIIAHRLTTVKDCDIIVELDKGSIAKIGTPREIL